MLEGLEQIDWLQIGASHIPDLLRNLTLPDRQVHRDAIRTLVDDLAPWEAFELGIYQHEELLNLAKRPAIIKTIPFLIALLREKTIQTKASLLELLADLLRYKDEIVEANLNEQEVKVYRVYAQRIYDEVYKGISLYNELTQDDDPEVKVCAGELLDELKAI